MRGERLNARIRVAQHYDITVTPDPENKRAVAITGTLDPSEGSLLHKPGVYSLRSNCLDWDADAMGKTYAMLTDVESVFRSLKSEPGLRPIDHHKDPHKDHRADGPHLDAAQSQILRSQGPSRGRASLHRGDRLTSAIQVLRTRRTQTGLTASWTTIRNTALPNADPAAIYQAMQIAPPARNRRKTVV